MATPRASRRLIRWQPAVGLLAGAALLLGACTSGNEGTDESPADLPPELVIASVEDSRDAPAGGGIEPANSESPPEGTLASGRDEVTLGLGTYCWSPPASSRQPSLCADAIGIITSTDDLNVEAGETITITGEVGTLPWPPMTIGSASLWQISAEPVAEGEDFRAWHPGDDAVVLETREEVGEHSIMLPTDLEPGRYVLSLSYTAGPDRGSDASYGAVLVVE